MNPVSLVRGNVSHPMLLAGAAFLVPLILAVLAYQVYLSYREQIRDTETRTYNYATILETRLDATLRRTDEVLQALAQSIPRRMLSRGASTRYVGDMARELDSRLPNFQELAGLRVFDAHGELLFSSDWANTPRINVEDRDYFRTLQRDPQAGLVFSEVLQSRATTRTSLVAARALQDKQGGFLGVITAVLDLARYEQVFRSADLGSNSVIALRRSDDQRLVVRWPRAPDEVNKPLEAQHPARLRISNGDRTASLQFVDSTDGIERIGSLHRLDHYPFYFLVGVRRQEVLADWQVRTAVVGVGGILLVVALGTLLGLVWGSGNGKVQAASDLTAQAVPPRVDSTKLQVFQRLVENAGQGIGMARFDGQIVYANPALRGMLGIALNEDCTDYSLDRFYDPEVHRRLREEILPVLVKTGRWTGELELVIPGAGTIPTIHTLFVIETEGDEPALIANVLADLSEHREMEERNRRLLAEMETLLANALVGIVHLRHRKIVACNRRIEEIFAYEPGELIGLSSEVFYPSRENFERIGVNAYAAIAADRAYSTESLFKRRDGSIFWGALTGRAIDPKQPQEGSIWVFADVSERRAAEEESKNLLQAVEQSPVSIVITNRDAEIEYVNPTFSRVSGYSRIEAIGQNPRILKSGETPEEAYRELWATLRSGKVWTGVFHNRRKNGELFWERASISPVFGDHGEVTHYLAVNEDVTERMHADKLLRESEEAFRRLFEDAKDPLLLLKGGQFIDCNTATLQLLGYRAKSDLVGRDPADISPEQQPDGCSSKAAATAMIEAALRYGYHRFEWVHQRGDGSTVPVEVTLTPITLHGEVIVHTLWRDISERRLTETRLRLLAAVFEHSVEAIMVTDRKNHIVEVNSAFCRVTGYAFEEVRGKDPRLLSSGRSSPEEYRALWESIERTGHWQGEIWDRRKDGSCYPKWLTISTIRGDDGTVEHYIGSFVDISERKAAEEKIRHLAHFDTLTDLPNRSNLQGRLDQALAAARRDGQSSPVALMFLDLDRFKNINDTLGHHVGDALLLEVSTRLRDSVRESDVVARLGGDEFVVVLTGADGVAAERVAGKILRALSQPYQIAGNRLHATSSIGIAVFPSDGDTVEVLMRNADAAMYHAKSAGRNNVQFFTASMNEAARDRRQLEEDLHQALSLDQFVLHYQPQINRRQEIFGVEALLRWQHPEHGLIAPPRFVPLAEDTGLIVPIGQWVLETACRQIVAWSGDTHFGHLQVAVNVSARQFRQADFVDHLQAVLETTRADARLLKLELTESLVLDDVSDTIAKMNAAKRLGVSFSMDDFGTGYSSLSYLTRLPLDQLKIDRAFVSRLPANRSDAVIAETIVTMGRSLGLKVVAEGVETEAQREFLESHGCHGYQGYLFSRPLPAGDLERFLVAQRA